MQKMRDIYVIALMDGADKILIDGAISRKSLCAPEVAKNTLLCTGASYDKSMEITVRDTAYVEELFLLPMMDLSQFKEEECIRIPGGERVSNILLNPEYKDKEYFLLQGALTDVGVQEVFMSFSDVSGKTLIVPDCSKVLLSSSTYEKLKKKGLSIKVLRSSKLVGITMNPYSAYGNHYDAVRFEEELNKHLKMKVMDVRRLN